MAILVKDQPVGLDPASPEFHGHGPVLIPGTPLASWFRSTWVSLRKKLQKTGCHTPSKFGNVQIHLALVEKTKTPGMSQSDQPTEFRSGNMRHAFWEFPAESLKVQFLGAEPLVATQQIRKKGINTK